VEAAKEAALDQLGVDEADAEFEVLAEPRPGLFGRLRGEARVRARVRPTKPRPKERSRDTRRQRRQSPGEAGERGRQQRAGAGQEATGNHGGGQRVTQGAGSGGNGPADDGAVDEGEQAPRAATTAAGTTRRRSRRRRGGGTSPGAAPPIVSPGSDNEPTRPNRHRPQEEDRQVEVALEEQAAVAKDFLDGLVAEIGLPADVAVGRLEEDTVELAIDGQDLGVLIGQRGATLLALQDLTRTVVQRRTGATNGRLLVDVAGYRRKRQQALARFAQQVATQVKAEGRSKALEPMSAADRKVVHDTINALEGVTTTSEGEDPRRYVVVLPQS
jgi:spoIIIJ-associated protein